MSSFRNRSSSDLGMRLCRKEDMHLSLPRWISRYMDFSDTPRTSADSLVEKASFWCPLWAPVVLKISFTIGISGRARFFLAKLYFFAFFVQACCDMAGAV
jgi:hypothetical protein